jgi:fluoride exporter
MSKRCVILSARNFTQLAMDRLQQYLLVFLGSGLGGAARFGVAQLVAWKLGKPVFPYATLIVNIVGSFLIALIITLATTTTAIAPNTRLFLATGIIGGFTTYSAFDFETMNLFQNGETVVAIANVGVTLVVCFVAGLLGFALARAIV